jgi:hypothetical protein
MVEFVCFMNGEYIGKETLKQLRGHCMYQVVKCLSSKHKALNSSPSITK